MAGRACKVSFTDANGIAHSAMVTADSLYEAAALAVRAFRQHGCPPGSATRLVVEVPSPSVVHTISVGKLNEYLDVACRSPNERITKQRLKELLA